MFPKATNAPVIKLIRENDNILGISKIEVTINGDSTKEELYQEFRNFLLAMGYHIDFETEVGEYNTFEEQFNTDSLKYTIRLLEDKLTEMEDKETYNVSNT